MSGEIAWSVKSSFRAYVAGVSDGTEISSDDVTVDAAGRYRFPLVSTGDDVLKATGWVRLSAYRGVLDVRIAEPWIEYRSGGGVVTIAHPRSERNPALPRMVLAEFGTDSVIRPELTFDGVRLLGEVYTVGAELDLLEVIHAPGA